MGGKGGVFRKEGRQRKGVVCRRCVEKKEGVRQRTPMGDDAKEGGIRKKKRKLKIRFFPGQEKTAQKRSIIHRVEDKWKGRRTIANKSKKIIFIML
jgi:hypothetical protein